MIRFWMSAGLGAYAGLTIGGAIALLSGEMIDTGDQWLTAVPALMIIGTPIGWAMAHLSRRWLLPRLAHRRLLFLIAGVVSCPLVVAVGSATRIEVSLALMVVGSAATTTVWRRYQRSMSSRGVLRH